MGSGNIFDHLSLNIGPTVKIADLPSFMPAKEEVQPPALPSKPSSVRSGIKKKLGGSIVPTQPVASQPAVVPKAAPAKRPRPTAGPNPFGLY